MPSNERPRLPGVQLLNAYCDDVAHGRRAAAARLVFWVREGDGRLVSIEAQLPAHGCLGPLFLAFGLITEDDLRGGIGSSELGEPWTPFLELKISKLAQCVRRPPPGESWNPLE